MAKGKSAMKTTPKKKKAAQVKPGRPQKCDTPKKPGRPRKSEVKEPDTPSRWVDRRDQDEQVARAKGDRFEHIPKAVRTSVRNAKKETIDEVILGLIDARRGTSKKIGCTVWTKLFASFGLAEKSADIELPNPTDATTPDNDLLDCFAVAHHENDITASASPLESYLLDRPKLGEGVQYALLRAFLPEAGVPTHVTTKGMVAILGHWADHDPPYYEKYFSATRHQCDLAVKTLWEELGEKM